MSTIASAVNTPFTPAIGSFVVQCTGGEARLDRRQTAGAAWTTVVTVGLANSFIIDNPVADVQYQFFPLNGTPVVQADQ